MGGLGSFSRPFSSQKCRAPRCVPLGTKFGSEEIGSQRFSEKGVSGGEFLIEKKAGGTQPRRNRGPKLALYTLNSLDDVVAHRHHQHALH